MPSDAFTSEISTYFRLVSGGVFSVNASSLQLATCFIFRTSQCSGILPIQAIPLSLYLSYRFIFGKSLELKYAFEEPFRILLYLAYVRHDSFD